MRKFLSREPLLRKPAAAPGEGEFEPISRDRSLDLLAARLGKIRAGAYATRAGSNAACRPRSTEGNAVLTNA